MKSILECYLRNVYYDHYIMMADCVLPASAIQIGYHNYHRNSTEQIFIDNGRTYRIPDYDHTRTTLVSLI